MAFPCDAKPVAPGWSADSGESGPGHRSAYGRPIGSKSGFRRAAVIAEKVARWSSRPRASMAQFLSHAIERVVWLLREGDSDFVAWSDNSGLQNNCHNSGFANYSSFVIVSHHRLQ